MSACSSMSSVMPRVVAAEMKRTLLVSQILSSAASPERYFGLVAVATGRVCAMKACAASLSIVSDWSAMGVASVSAGGCRPGAATIARPARSARAHNLVTIDSSRLIYRRLALLAPYFAAIGRRLPPPRQLGKAARARAYASRPNEAVDTAPPAYAAHAKNACAGGWHRLCLSRFGTAIKALLTNHLHTRLCPENATILLGVRNEP